MRTIHDMPCIPDGDEAPTPMLAPAPFPLPETRLGLQQARSELIAPLFAYCAARGITVIFIARAAARRVGIQHVSRVQLQRIKNGYSRLPVWFIAGVCREIGQPIEVVMGEEWAQRHLPPAPTTELPTQRPTQTRTRTQPTQTQKAS